MKTIRSMSLLLALLMLLSSTLLAGCERAQKHYEVPNYQGIVQEGQTRTDFNKELFYRNDKQANCPDPFVLDNTARDGYYYLYGTEGSVFCYRSKDLMDWEPVGNALDNMDYAVPGGLTEVRRATWKQIWAPEVVYDPEEKLYYLFFSATPEEDSSVKVGQGVEKGDGYELMMVAVSLYPDHGFRLVNFRDAESCGEENLHTYNTKAGTKDSKGNYVPAYPHYYAKYLFFDPAQYRAFSDANGGYRGAPYGGYEGGIDPHPYVDANGDKYLFWVDSTGADRLCVVKMENWLKPDWSTATVVTYHTYYTVEDWQAAQRGESVELVSYELEDVRINEGPAVIAHNGKYYLTFSVGRYSDNSYQVAQAVADSVMGPYRKLTAAEGAILMSGEAAGSQEVSGTGHHAFITVGEKLYMIYHRHNDFTVAGAARNPGIDEVKWITVKDKDGNDLDVMYANGPTCTLQPRLEGFSKYVNIAGEATVTGSEDTRYLTDGLLSIYKYADADFEQYVQETAISETTTFTLDFAEARTVRAIMVYNSKMEYSAFTRISRIELVCEEEGKEVIRFIKDLSLSPEYYMANDYDGSIYYVTPGAAIHTEFDELNVKTIRITVEVPEGQETVGISEIRVLGK